MTTLEVQSNSSLPHEAQLLGKNVSDPSVVKAIEPIGPGSNVANSQSYTSMAPAMHKGGNCMLRRGGKSHKKHHGKSHKKHHGKSHKKRHGKSHKKHHGKSHKKH